jgi:hypothetical protein
VTPPPMTRTSTTSRLSSAAARSAAVSTGVRL